MYYLYASNLLSVQSLLLSVVSRIKPLLLASTVSILLPNITVFPWMLPQPPLPPISLCPPFYQPQSISAEQPIPFSKARPCHSSAQNPPKACQHGAKAKSYLGWTLVIGTHLQPLSPLFTLALATLASIVQMTMPSTFCHRAFALAALCPSSSLQVYPLLHFRSLLKCYLISMWPFIIPPKSRATPLNRPGLAHLSRLTFLLSTCHHLMYHMNTCVSIIICLECKLMTAGTCLVHCYMVSPKTVSGTQ